MITSHTIEGIRRELCHKHQRIIYSEDQHHLPSEQKLAWSQLGFALVQLGKLYGRFFSMLNAYALLNVSFPT